MKIKPFRALRPTEGNAEAVASVPYDTVNVAEARLLAGDNAASFLRVVRADLEFSDDQDPYSVEVYRRAASNLDRLVREGVLRQDDDSAVYVYRQVMGGHSQRGVVACCHVDDYRDNLIKRHEKTLRKKEDDRLNHLLALNANTGPVFLAYRDDQAVDELVGSAEAGVPLYDFTAIDGVRHTVWKMDDHVSSETVGLFAHIDSAYVADGHHRAAAAFRAAGERQKANPAHDGGEEYNWFMAVLFPSSQLQVLPYNRAVKTLNGLETDVFLERVRSAFSLEETRSSAPARQGQCCMYLRGVWYRLKLEAEAGDANPVSLLDVSILQDRLLGPVLGIEDPRTNANIDFVGGIRGTAELERLVDEGRAAVAFSMYPVSVDQLMDVSDAGMIMAPKSTWFEPKLRSGLLVHMLD